MLKKKQIVVALTSAVLCVGMGASFAAVQTGGAGSGSSAGGTKSGDTRSTTGASSTACKAAKAQVAKDNPGGTKSKDEGKNKSLTHHSKSGEDGRSKQDTDAQAKRQANLDKMNAACTDATVKKSDDQTKSKESEGKNKNSENKDDSNKNNSENKDESNKKNDGNQKDN